MKDISKTYDRNVFINCPFDAEYAPLFRAALFAIVDCGFTPRTALDVSDGSEVRIQKIYNIIGSSRLSVHDLSRTQLDITSNLPRFNMPLEFGIFLGAKFLGDAKQRQKACLVFDEKPHRYQTYLSDVAGQDISWHSNDPRTLIFRIRDWLAHLSNAPIPSGSLIFDHFITFMGELRHSCERLRQKVDELTHRDFLHHVTAFKDNYVETLEIEGKNSVKNPNSVDIRRAMRRLQNKEDAIIILCKGANELSYIQAYHDGGGKWTLEYQDGHLDEHYKAENHVDGEYVSRSFQYYCEGDERWKTQTRWKRIEI